MKKIIIPKDSDSEIKVESLMGNESIAYRCQNSEGICVLARLRIEQVGSVESYGFIPLNAIGKPRFVGRSFFDCVKLAGKYRQLYVFTSVQDLIKVQSQPQQ